MKNIFISGISSGIGKSLAIHFADLGINVYGISRKVLDYKHENIHHAQVDLTEFDSIDTKIKDLLSNSPNIDLAVLNAGVLGNMSTMKDAFMTELKSVMDTNLWSQKILLDTLLKLDPAMKRVIGISSGAAVNGSKGWSGYSLSKAAFNMLIQLYASENEITQFIALAPGLVDTGMQEYISSVSSEEFPGLARLQAARGTDTMPSPDTFALKFAAALPKLESLESGSFIDIRKM